MLISKHMQRFIESYDEKTKIATVDIPALKKTFKNFIVAEKKGQWSLRRIDMRKTGVEKFLFEVRITKQQAEELIATVKLIKVADPLQTFQTTFYVAKYDAEYRIKVLKVELNAYEQRVEEIKSKLRYWEGII